MHPLTDRRRELGLTQSELARASGLTRPLISAVETDRHTPSVKAAIAMARALGTSVEQLFGSMPALEEHNAILGKERRSGTGVVAVNVGQSLSYQPLAEGGAAGIAWDRADGIFRDGRVELFEDADPSGFVVAGCDPALGLAASLLPRRGPQRLLAVPSSTAAAIEALEEGRVHAAAVHGPGNGKKGEIHVPETYSRPTIRPVRRFVVARWQVGIATRAGTKKAIELLANGKLKVAGREVGAEAQRALERRLLAAGGVILRQGPIASGHLDAARHVAYGSADVAATMEAAAIAYGLDFSPLEDHTVELRLAEEWESHPGAKAFLELLNSRALISRLEALGGYDLRRAGDAA